MEGAMQHFFIIVILSGVLLTAASAHDRHRADSQTPKMKEWFDTLKSGKGPCCSDADGSVVKDSDWEADDKGHYRVHINGQWMDVPDDAVLHQPNMYGRTMVWTGLYIDGKVQIRCFIPGMMI